MKKTLKTIGFVIILLALGSIVAHAYNIDSDLRPVNQPLGSIGTQGAENGTIILLQIIAGGLLYFAAPVATIAVAFAAFDMVMGGAESEKLEQSKKFLTWAVIGLILIIMSYSLTKIIITIISQATSLG